MVRWALKKGADRRFRSGHPWIFSNELLASPKGISPGALVELLDHQGNFLAFGYGHPNSLISFRELTRSSKEEPNSDGFFVSKFQKMVQFRNSLGLKNASYRLCFGEADGLPGLIVDRYVVSGSLGQWLVIQAQTAGAEVLTQSIMSALESLSTQEQLGFSWNQTGVIVKNDSSMRGLEGLKIEPAVISKSMEGVDPSRLQIQVRSAARGESLKFNVDLIDGQKTGFFLDQSYNIDLTAKILSDRLESSQKKKIRILDLCPYVGQWGSQLSALVVSLACEVEVVLFDASEDALAKATENVKLAGGQPQAIKGDVLKDLDKVEGLFDVVICDPPAFIKSRKDLGPGEHAYFKMNAAALSKCDRNSIYVSCSCSGLFTDTLFAEMLQKAERRSGKLVRWIACGEQGPDHPVRSFFPEGKYLKCRIGITD